MNFEDVPRPGFWKRFLAGAALVVFAAASATAVAAFREVDKVVDALRNTPELELGNELATTDPGEPQTIMLIGSDRRSRTARDFQVDRSARSDTIILVRLAPDKEATALMSLPRDLKVQIPGRGVAKINEAYELGGPKLTLKTVKAVTGLRINHVVNVNFQGFVKGIDALGCIYLDIDRRYYNDGIAATDYAPIDLQPGYQRKCGQKALEFARFRHEDTDIVRAARQQNVLRAAKQQIGVTDLFNDRDKLIKIFGDYTRTDADLRSRAEVIRILRLAVFSVDQPIREVHFRGRLGASYVTSSSASIRKMTREFLGVEDTPGPRGEPRRRRSGGDLNLVKLPQFGQQQALQAIEAGAGGRLPVYYPRVLTQGSMLPGPPRVYKMRDLDGKRHLSYRMVIDHPGLGEYWGVQGTTWKDPPILENDFDERKIGKRTFELHYDGDRLRLVAWRTNKAVYWISNTLLQSLSKREMVAIARSTRLP